MEGSKSAEGHFSSSYGLLKLKNGMEEGRVNDLMLHCGNGALLVYENSLDFSMVMV